MVCLSLTAGLYYAPHALVYKATIDYKTSVRGRTMLSSLRVQHVFAPCVVFGCVCRPRATQSGRRYKDNNSGQSHNGTCTSLSHVSLRMSVCPRDL